MKCPLGVIYHNKFGFSPNCRGKTVGPLTPEISDAWLLYPGQLWREQLALGTEQLQAQSLDAVPGGSL